MRRAVTCLVPLFVLAAGCGGSSSSDATSTTGTTTAATTTKPPAALVGTYATTLTTADIPANPPIPLRGQKRWDLTITPDGAVDNAPGITIVKPPSTPLESATLVVKGDTLTLDGERCFTDARANTLTSSTYRWVLSGSTLKLTPVKVGCKDGIADTILRSQAWTKTG